MTGSLGSGAVTITPAARHTGDRGRGRPRSRARGRVRAGRGATD
jgi:hypothetical protein